MLATYQELSASIKSEKTAFHYKGALRRYLEYRKLDSLSQLLPADEPRFVKLIESDIIAYLIHMKDRKTSWSHRNGQLSALKHFYRMNDIQLNWIWTLYYGSIVLWL